MTLKRFQTVLVLSAEAPPLPLDEAFLAREGYRVEREREVNSASLASLAPKLVVLDVPSIESDAAALCRALRTDVAGATILATVPPTGIALALALRDAGADAVLFHPLDAYAFNQQIGILIGPTPRRCPRRPVRLAVDTSRSTGFTWNLSASGMLLQTAEPVPIDSEIDLRFALPGTDTLLEAKAQVVRSEGASSERRVGIHFTRIGEQERQLLARFLAMAC